MYLLDYPDGFETSGCLGFFGYRLNLSDINLFFPDMFGYVKLDMDPEGLLYIRRIHTPTTSFLLQCIVVSPLEPYKGKGIMYVDEVIKEKQGKKSK
jgi:hypothetical protein